MGQREKERLKEIRRQMDATRRGEVVKFDEDGQIEVPSRPVQGNTGLIIDSKGEYAFQMSPGLCVQPFEAARPRWPLEQEKLSQFPSFELFADRGRVTQAQGFLRPSGLRWYAVSVEVPEAYPYSMPEVRLPGCELAGAPHCYSGGRLCLMRSGQWSSNFTLAFVVAKTAIWIAKLEVWRDSGVWPGNEQAHGTGLLSSFLGV